MCRFEKPIYNHCTGSKCKKRYFTILRVFFSDIFGKFFGVKFGTPKLCLCEINMKVTWRRAALDLKAKAGEVEVNTYHTLEGTSSKVKKNSF